MRRSVRTTLSALAVGALAVGSLALGAGTASAAISPTVCASGSGDARTIVTAANVWFEVCLATGATNDAMTAHKSDAFDGFGDLYLNYGAAGQVALLADSDPIVQEVNGDELVVDWSDMNVQWAPGDLVDVYVQRSIKGSTQAWSFTIVDSDDGVPRTDVTVDLRGELGSDGNATYQFPGSAYTMVAYGDRNDPVVVLQSHGATGSGIGTEPLSDDVFAQVTGSGSRVDVAVIDYTCQNESAALDYALTFGDIDLGAMYGQTLTTPGSAACLTAPSPIYLTPGAAFDLPVQVAFGPEFDFSQGGYLTDWYGNVEFAEYDEFGTTPGMTPGLRMSGTAPTALGTYFLVVQGYSNVNNVAEQALIQVIVGAPPAQLAATGSETSPMLVAGALALLLAGAGALMLVRRRAART